MRDYYREDEWRTLSPDERPPGSTPCYGNPWPYDVLIDRTGGYEWVAALWEARQMCGSCQAMPRCHMRWRDEGWVKAIRAGGWPHRETSPRGRSAREMEERGA